MQLLKITNIPIEYQFKIEPARLEMTSEQPGYKIDRRPSQLRIKSDNIEMRMDSKDMRRSMGYNTVADEVSEAAQRGKQAALEATAQYAQDGNKLAQGVNIGQIAADKLIGQPATTVLTFLPSVGPAITWKPNQIQMQYDPGDINFDWQVMRNTMDYVPGKFSMDILQYPKVEIEYLGEPSYVPPSANPNYEEPA